MKGLFFLFVVLFSSFLFERLNAEESDEYCSDPSILCPYGAIVNMFSRNIQCCIPPGGLCGGLMGSVGKCARGLTCKCNKCSGCAQVDFQCYEEPGCNPPINPHIRHYTGPIINPYNLTTMPYKRPFRFYDQ